MPLRYLTLLAVALAVGACRSDAPTEPGDRIFHVLVCRGSLDLPAGEVFRIRILDPALAAEAEALIGAGHVRIVTGNVVRGDGGFNAPWSWHLDPASIAFVDSAAEYCDACPNEVEATLDHWIASVGIYCPYTTELIGRD
jgi:hypothetical protein